MGSWRMGGNKARFMRTLILADEVDPDNSKIECLSNPDGSFEISVHSRVAEMECSGDGDETIIDSYTISGTLSTNNCLNVVINGTKRISCTAVIYEDELSDAPKLFVNMWVKNHLKESGVDYAWSMALQHPLLVNRSQEASTQVGSGSVKAPMPGKITKVHVVEGQKVLKSDILIVMEAMKMEHTIRAPSDGTVVSLLSLPGEIVKDGDILVLVEDDEASTSTVFTDENIVA
jgi:biotin carboxyl carrier protein